MRPPPLMPCQRPSMVTPAGGGAPVLIKRASASTTEPFGIFQLTMNFMGRSPWWCCFGGFGAESGVEHCGGAVSRNEVQEARFEVRGRCEGRGLTAPKLDMPQSHPSGDWIGTRGCA